jgi:hypothetical protein
MLSLFPLPGASCHFVYVVCMPLSLRQSLYNFDAYRHDSRQPPGLNVPPGLLSPLRP